MWRLRAIRGWIEWLAGPFRRLLWGWTVGIYAIIIEDSKILLVNSGGYWLPPGGFFPSGRRDSDPLTFLKKRVRDEVGIGILEVGERPLLGDITSEVFTRDLATFLLVTKWSGDLHLSLRKGVTQARFYSKEEIPHLHLTRRVEQAVKTAFINLSKEGSK